jgi:hypothetical protein
MQAGNIPEILELEKKAPSAWSEDHFKDELQQAAGFQFVAETKQQRVSWPRCSVVLLQTRRKF